VNQPHVLTQTRNEKRETSSLDTRRLVLLVLGWPFFSCDCFSRKACEALSYGSLKIVRRQGWTFERNVPTVTVNGFIAGE
jgi:hypothetical protein